MTDPLGFVSTIETIYKYGHFIADKVQAYRNAPALVKEFEDLGKNVYTGTLATNIRLTEVALKDDTTPVASKDALLKYIDRLGRQLKEAADVLEEFVKKDGTVRRGLFSIREGDKALRDCLNNFTTTQALFLGHYQLLDLNRTNSSRANLLTSENFRLIHTQEDETEPSQVGYLSVQFRQAKFKVGNEMIITPIILEKREHAEGDDETLLMNTTSDLARTLSTSSLERPAILAPTDSPGILNCLGYRKTPLELVFQVPVGAQKPESLWTLMSRSFSTAQPFPKAAGGYSLEDRFNLALQLSRAVLSVHSKRLVHKNIRPNTIIFFQKQPLQDQNQANALSDISTPYLSHWNVVQRPHNMSISDPNLTWEDDIYRHPERQGLYNKPDYHMGHDIYSLGVCLLEIGLWEPLLSRKGSNQSSCYLSKIFSDAAVYLGYMKAEDVGSVDRAVEPFHVKSTLLELATQLLPSKVGSKYAQVVISCLNCAEEGFGDVAGLTDANVIGVELQEQVVRLLSELKV